MTVDIRASQIQVRQIGQIPDLRRKASLDSGIVQIQRYDMAVLVTEDFRPPSDRRFRTPVLVGFPIRPVQGIE